MNAKETINTWRWRIVKAGHNVKSFCEIVDISQTTFSQYLTGKRTPSLERFDVIENTLKEMEV